MSLSSRIKLDLPLSHWKIMSSLLSTSLLNLILNSQVIPAVSNASCLPFYTWSTHTSVLNVKAFNLFLLSNFQFADEISLRGHGGLSPIGSMAIGFSPVAKFFWEEMHSINKPLPTVSVIMLVL